MQSGMLMTRGLVLLCVFGALGAISATGCKKVAAPAPAPSPAPSGNPGSSKTPDIDPSDKFASAKGVFKAQCSRCHATEAPTEGGGMRRGGNGPNLAKVSANPDHTKEWLAEHIRDPKAHKPQSRMPKFADKLKPDELKSLVDYLASLK